MSKSLMIVDDSATMRKIIMRTLQTAGLDIGQTEEAGNGNEALEKLNAGGPFSDLERRCILFLHPLYYCLALSRSNIF